MDKIQMELFEQLTGLHEIPAGAYNIRANSKKDSRNTTANIDIVTKTALIFMLSREQKMKVCTSLL